MDLVDRLAALPTYKIVSFQGVTDDCDRLGDVLFYVPFDVDVTDMEPDDVADRALLTVWHYARPAR